MTWAHDFGVYCATCSSHGVPALWSVTMKPGSCPAGGLVPSAGCGTLGSLAGRIAYIWMLPSILLRKVRMWESCGPVRLTVISVLAIAAAGALDTSFAVFVVSRRTSSLTSPGFWSV